MKEPTKLLNWQQETLINYLAELSLSSSETTCNSYKGDLTRFLTFIAEKNIKKVATLKPLHIINYLSYCKSIGRTDSTINRYYMAIRSYCRYLRRQKLLPFDLTEDITPPRSSLKAPSIPTIEEMGKIISQPNVCTESGMRDRALMELMYSSGLRATELCNLELEDFKGSQVTVKCGKRGKTRTVPITQEAWYWIESYIEEYRGKDEGYLFLTQMGRQIRRQYLCAIIIDNSAKAGMKDVTPHTFRHACATHLLDRGADIRLIQEVLGHASISTTQRYTHLSSCKMQEMFQQFHPRRA